MNFRGFGVATWNSQLQLHTQINSLSFWLTLVCRYRQKSYLLPKRLSTNKIVVKCPHATNLCIIQAIWGNAEDAM